MKVAEFFASFSIQPDTKSIAAMNRTFRTMRGAAIGFGAFFASGALFKGLVGFNAKLEDAKLGIAGMLALVRKTSVTDELKTASQLYDDIRKKAADLPGTTQEYVEALQRMTQPVLSAGGGLEDLKEIVADTITLAKTSGIATPKVAVTDVIQAIGGRFATTDFFLQMVLGQKFDGEQGRKRFRKLSKSERLKEIKEAFSAQQIEELQKRQAKTFSSQMDKMKEALQQFLGRVGLPLFKALTSALQRANEWLKNNQETVEKLADKIGGALSWAFGVLSGALKWLVEHGDAAKAMLQGLLLVIGVMIGKMLANWAIFASPWIRMWAAISLLIWVFEKLRDKIGTVGAVLVAVFGAALLMKFSAVTTAIWGMVKAMFGLATASRAAAVAQAGVATASRWNQLAGGLAMPGVAGAKTFAARTAGSVAGGASRLATFARFGGPIAGGIAGLLGAHWLAKASGDPKGLLSIFEGQDYHRRLSAKALGMGDYYERLDTLNGKKPVTQNISAPLTINITGVDGADDAVRRIQKEHDKAMRNLQYAVGGAAR